MKVEDIKKEPALSDDEDVANSQSSDACVEDRDSLLKKAPVVAFGADLEYWENPDKLKAPIKVK